MYNYALIAMAVHVNAVVPIGLWCDSNRLMSRASLNILGFILSNNGPLIRNTHVFVKQIIGV